MPVEPSSLIFAPLSLTTSTVSRTIVLASETVRSPRLRASASLLPGFASKFSSMSNLQTPRPSGCNGSEEAFAAPSGSSMSRTRLLRDGIFTLLPSVNFVTSTVILWDVPTSFTSAWKCHSS